MEKRTTHIGKYYTSLESMKRRMENSYRSEGFFGPYSVDSHEKWREKASSLLSSLLGLDIIRKGAGDLSFNERKGETVMLADGIRREHIYIDVEEGVTMPLYILHPIAEPKGTIICYAGHNGAGKESVAGDDSSSAVREKIEKYGYDYGLFSARLGYTAVCPDPRGFGERREKAMEGDEEEKFLRSSCKELANMAIGLGFSLMGLLVWDSMRLVDYLKTRKDLSSSSLIALGFSGGGMQALYSSALDNRIDKTIISGYFYGFEDSLLELNSNCQCNYVPGVFSAFDMGDIASLIAPRPLAIQAAKGDHLEGKRGMENVMEQMEIVDRVYAIYGKKVYLDTPEGDHAFHKENLKEILSCL